MYWYVSTLGYWEARLTPRFQIDMSTHWWSGVDWEAGTPIEYHGQVVAATQKSSHESYPDFFKLGLQTMASERFRNLVEAVEPDVHQFFPVKLVNNLGGIVDPPYFLFNITQAYECIVIEKSDVHWHEWDGRGVDDKPMKFRRLRIGSADGLVTKK